MPDHLDTPEVYRVAVRLGTRACLMEARALETKPLSLEARFKPASSERKMRQTAEWILHTDLDLRPFYRLVRDHAVLGPIVKALRGLVAMRMPSPFIMAVTSITEQQISMIAAYRIRERIIERYGEKVDELRAFPTPEALAGASVRDLKRLGLSTRKAEYITGLSRRIAGGDLDLDEMKLMSDADAREFCMSIRGLGPWAADYMLVRGLGRPDAVPADDLGIQKLVGFYLGDGKRLTSRQVREAMAPFAPFRGIAVFYRWSVTA